MNVLRSMVAVHARVLAAMLTGDGSGSQRRPGSRLRNRSSLERRDADRDDAALHQRLAGELGSEIARAIRARERGPDRHDGAVIELQSASRSYGSRVALLPCDLVVPGGAVVGLLGANGAGKTTLLSLVTTLLPPTSGQVIVAGHDVTADPLAVRRSLGYVPEHAACYEGLTADETLELAAAVRGLPEATWRPRADRLLRHLGLHDDRTRRLGTYSKGMRSKALLAVALLHDPQVLVLDEPLNGLDVAGQRLLTSLLREVADAGRTVLYSSHVLEQVERACDILVLLHQGRLLWTGRVHELRAAHGGAPLADVFVAMTEPRAQGRPVSWAELLGA